MTNDAQKLSKEVNIEKLEDKAVAKTSSRSPTEHPQKKVRSLNFNPPKPQALAPPTSTGFSLANMPSLEKMAQKARAKPKTAVKPKQITKKAPTPLVDTFKSTEYINSSDSEEEEGDSEVEDEKTKALAVVAPGVNGNGGVESASSSSESESEEKSSSEEESGSEDEMEIDEPSPPPSSILKYLPTIPISSNFFNKSRKPSITTKPRPLEPKKYTSRLPPSFKPLTISESTAASKLLKKSNLEGKQIWYFTAPSSVPITSIQKISLREGDGDTVKHAGNEYGFVEGTVAVGTKIMVPSSTDGGYKTCKTPSSLLSRLSKWYLY